jgi:hypothetical protein
MGVASTTPRLALGMAQSPPMTKMGLAGHPMNFLIFLKKFGLVFYSFKDTCHFYVTLRYFEPMKTNRLGTKFVFSRKSSTIYGRI